MVILGLGTNVGNRLAYLEAAVGYLSASVVNITNISPIYESPALLEDGAPLDWNSAFLNMAISGTTNLSPQELLINIKKIEQQVGRKTRGKWAPREIDIDILAYGNCNVNEKNLQIPHAALCSRDFALLPLADIAPNWQHPENGKTAAEIAKNIQGDAVKTNLAIKFMKQLVA